MKIDYYDMLSILETTKDEVISKNKRLGQEDFMPSERLLRGFLNMKMPLINLFDFLKSCWLLNGSGEDYIQAVQEKLKYRIHRKNLEESEIDLECLEIIKNEMSSQLKVNGLSTEPRSQIMKKSRDHSIDSDMIEPIEKKMEKAKRNSFLVESDSSLDDADFLAPKTNANFKSISKRSKNTSQEKKIEKELGLMGRSTEHSKFNFMNKNLNISEINANHNRGESFDSINFNGNKNDYDGMQTKRKRISERSQVQRNRDDQQNSQIKDGSLDSVNNKDKNLNVIKVKDRPSTKIKSMNISAEQFLLGRNSYESGNNDELKILGGKRMTNRIFMEDSDMDNEDSREFWEELKNPRLTKKAKEKASNNVKRNYNNFMCGIILSYNPITKENIVQPKEIPNKADFNLYSSQNRSTNNAGNDFVDSYLNINDDDSNHNNFYTNNNYNTNLPDINEVTERFSSESERHTNYELKSHFSNASRNMTVNSICNKKGQGGVYLRNKKLNEYELSAKNSCISKNDMKDKFNSNRRISNAFNNEKITQKSEKMISKNNLKNFANNLKKQIEFKSQYNIDPHSVLIKKETEKKTKQVNSLFGMKREKSESTFKIINSSSIKQNLGKPESIQISPKTPAKKENIADIQKANLLKLMGNNNSITSDSDINELISESNRNKRIEEEELSDELFQKKQFENYMSKSKSKTKKPNTNTNIKLLSKKKANTGTKPYKSNFKTSKRNMKIKTVTELNMKFKKPLTSEMGFKSSKKRCSIDVYNNIQVNSMQRINMKSDMKTKHNKLLNVKITAKNLDKKYLSSNKYSSIGKTTKQIISSRNLPVGKKQKKKTMVKKYSKDDFFANTKMTSTILKPYKKKQRGFGMNGKHKDLKSINPSTTTEHSKMTKLKSYETKVNSMRYIPSDRFIRKNTTINSSRYINFNPVEVKLKSMRCMPHKEKKPKKMKVPQITINTEESTTVESFSYKKFMKCLKKCFGDDYEQKSLRSDISEFINKLFDKRIVGMYAGKESQRVSGLSFYVMQYDLFKTSLTKFMNDFNAVSTTSLENMLEMAKNTV